MTKPHVCKFTSLSDMFGGVATLFITSQLNESYSLPLDRSMLKYIESRIAAVLLKGDEKESMS